MSSIKHGRRRGQTQGDPCDLDDSCRNNSAPPSQNYSQAPPKTMVLTQHDFDRMMFTLNKKQIIKQQQARERDEREALKEKSRDMVKNWSNTVIGARSKKLEARTLRDEEDEVQRKVLDVEEAKINAEKRKIAIEEAKQKQYYQTDRVKQFHSALLLSECLKEREAQLELKRLKALAEEGKDGDFQSKAALELEKQKAKDFKAEHERQLAAGENRSFVQRQIHSKLKRAEQDKLEDWREGRELEKLGELYLRERAELDSLRKDDKGRLAYEIQSQVQEKRQLQQLEQKQEEQEDEECRLFANAKRKMMKLKAQRETQMHDAKMARLDKIKAKLYAQQMARISNEDQIFQSAVQEKEIAQAEEDAAKLAARQEGYRQQMEHMQIQKQELLEAKSEAAKEEQRLLNMDRDADLLYFRNEEEKKARRGNAARIFAANNKQDGDRKVVEGKVDRIKEVAQFNMDQEVMMKEEELFQDYARRVINHCEQKGRNTYPMKKTAKLPEHQPKNGDMIVSGAGEEIKGKFLGRDTYKRLGMVYQ